MPQATTFRRVVPFLGLAGAACSMLALAWALPGAEALLDRGFDTALGEARKNDASKLAQADGGGDRLWLSRVEHTAEPLALLGPLAVGDRITISGADGEARVLHVDDIREISAPTRLASAAEPRLLMVTCHVAGQDQAKPVRFIVEAGQPDAPQPAGTRARVL